MTLFPSLFSIGSMSSSAFWCACEVGRYDKPLNGPRMPAMWQNQRIRLPFTGSCPNLWIEHLRNRMLRERQEPNSRDQYRPSPGSPPGRQRQETGGFQRAGDAGAAERRRRWHAPCRCPAGRTIPTWHPRTGRRSPSEGNELRPLKAGDGFASNTRDSERPGLDDPFLDSLAREDLAPATLRGYRYDLRHFLAWHATVQSDAFALDRLAAFELIAYRQHMVAPDGAPPRSTGASMPCAACAGGRGAPARWAAMSPATSGRCARCATASRPV